MKQDLLGICQTNLRLKTLGFGYQYSKNLMDCYDTSNKDMHWHNQNEILTGRDPTRALQLLYVQNLPSSTKPIGRKSTGALRILYVQNLSGSKTPIGLECTRDLQPPYLETTGFQDAKSQAENPLGPSDFSMFRIYQVIRHQYAKNPLGLSDFSMFKIYQVLRCQHVEISLGLSDFSMS